MCTEVHAAGDTREGFLGSITQSALLTCLLGSHLERGGGGEGRVSVMRRTAGGLNIVCKTKCTILSPADRFVCQIDLKKRCDPCVDDK